MISWFNVPKSVIDCAPQMSILPYDCNGIEFSMDNWLNKPTKQIESLK